jgi:hypothetical protein
MPWLFVEGVMTLDPPLRPALTEDAPVLAELVNYAGDGLPLHLWSKMAAPGESAWDVGRCRAARREGGFSYRNATIIEHRGECGSSSSDAATAKWPRARW